MRQHRRPARDGTQAGRVCDELSEVDPSRPGLCYSIGMNTDSAAPNSKSNRKTSARSGHDRKAYDDTAFGRRRTTFLPRWFWSAFRALIGRRR